MNAPKLDSLKLVKEHSLPAIGFAIAKRPDAAKVYLGTSDFKVSVADLSAPKFELQELYTHESYVTGVALVGEQLISGSYDGTLVWYDLAKKTKVRTLPAHTKWIRNIVLSPDGTTLASVADDMTCKLWDTKTGAMKHELRGHADRTPNGFVSMLYAVAFSADGKQLATGDKVGKVCLWDTKTGKQTATLDAPGFYTWDAVARLHSIGGIRSLAFSPDGKTLAIGGMGKVGNIDHLEGKARLELFDVSTQKSIAEVISDKFAGLVNRLVFAPDGSWLLGAGGAGEGFLLGYDVATKKLVKQDKASTHIHDFTIDPAFTQLITVGHNKLSSYRLG